MVQTLDKNLVLCVGGFNEDNFLIHIDDNTLLEYSKCNSQPLNFEYKTSSTKFSYTLIQQQILFGKPIFFVEKVITEPIKYENKKIPMYTPLVAEGISVTC